MEEKAILGGDCDIELVVPSLNEPLPTPPCAQTLQPPRATDAPNALLRQPELRLVWLVLLIFWGYA
jgi:hypothetical protein